jgi:hypothetical protein
VAKKKKKSADEDEKKAKKRRGRVAEEEEDEDEEFDDAEYGEDDESSSPKNNVYVGLGVITLLALLTAAVFLYLDASANKAKNPPAASLTVGDLKLGVGGPQPAGR